MYIILHVDFLNSVRLDISFPAHIIIADTSTESLRFIMDLVFRDLKLHRAMAWALPDNTASIRLLERVGFVYEASAMII